MSESLIIGITAFARAGKDTFASRLASVYSFIQLNMSDVLRDELIRQGRDQTKDNMSIIGDELRSKFGKDIVIRLLLDKAAAYDKVVISGLRSPEEVVYLKNNSKNFILVHIDSPLESRFKRRNSLDPQDIKSFAARDERDIKNKGLDKVIEMANHKIENQGDLDNFYSEIDNFMKYAKERNLLP